MNDYITNIDNQLKTFLQKNLILRLNDQIYKNGKLLLYTHGYFTFLFTFKNYKKNKNEIIKLPVPFNCVSLNTNKILFDYRIKTLFIDNNNLEELFKTIKKPHLSKFYDKILSMEVYV